MFSIKTIQHNKNLNYQSTNQKNPVSDLKKQRPKMLRFAHCIMRTLLWDPTIGELFWPYDFIFVPTLHLRAWLYVLCWILRWFDREIRKILEVFKNKNVFGNKPQVKKVTCGSDRSLTAIITLLFCLLKMGLSQWFLIWLISHHFMSARLDFLLLIFFWKFIIIF